LNSPRGQVPVESSAGGIVLRWLEGEPHVLLIRDPYRNWGLPKGHLEAGEDARQAAEREVFEETGLSGLDVGAEVGTIEWFYRQGGRLVRKRCTFFLMRSETGDTVPEAEEGITECVWFPIVEAVERITYENTRETLRQVASQLAEGLEPGARGV